VKRGKEKGKHHAFQQGCFSPLQTWTKIISVLLALVLTLTACCAPTTNTTATALPETAFTATFLGFASDGKTILVKPERSSTNVQLIYNTATNLTAGQRVYVLGRLEGNLVYVSELRKLN
jgi:hypothetical protein